MTTVQHGTTAGQAFKVSGRQAHAFFLFCHCFHTKFPLLLRRELVSMGAAQGVTGTMYLGTKYLLLPFAAGSPVEL